MKPFAYTSSESVDDVIALLTHDAPGTARPLAGGTDLLTLMKADIAAPERLIDIKRLADLPRGIVEDGAGLALGALATLSEIEADARIKARYPILAEAAAVAATPQLRNMATIAGNMLQRPRCWYFRSPHFNCWLKGGENCPAREGENQLHALFGGGPCYAVHPSDLAPALLALDATVRVRGPAGERTLPLAELFALPEDARRTETILAPDELVLSINLPPQPENARGTYLKAMDRKVWAFALVGLAATLHMDAGGTIAGARLVLSGVAPVPWRATAAEEVLVGQQPGAEVFARAADLAIKGAEPLEHNGYKLPLARALVQRALATLAEKL